MENKGVIISGGQFNAENVSVGDNSKITITHSTPTGTKKGIAKDTTFSEKIKDIIKEGKIKEASDLLFTHFKANGNKEALNAMIMHISVLQGLQMQENLDTITHEQAKIDRAKVINAVLNLVDNQM
jgi:hypothetical protein